MFALTKTEKRILAFVLLAFLAGWGLRAWETTRLYSAARASLPNEPVE